MHTASVYLAKSARPCCQKAKRHTVMFSPWHPNMPCARGFYLSTAGYRGRLVDRELQTFPRPSPRRDFYTFMDVAHVELRRVSTLNLFCNRLTLQDNPLLLSRCEATLGEPDSFR